jgi:LAGLIDADG endonuclease
MNTKQKNKLNPFWVSGFVDGEGRFFISIYKSTKLKTQHQIRIGFKITQGVKNSQV